MKESSKKRITSNTISDTSTIQNQIEALGRIRDMIFKATQKYNVNYVTGLITLRHISEQSGFDNITKDFNAIIEDMERWIYYFNDKYEDVDNTIRRLVLALLLKYLKVGSFDDCEQGEKDMLIRQIEEMIEKQTFENILSIQKSFSKGDICYGKEKN